ncbi:MAG: hypothetical protein NTV80_17315 [Verrucomicrobia bacterium]|nr:hypothetical protein [Verrucomicrobiota bacterium]
MFKKILASLSKSQTAKTEAPKQVATPAPAAQPAGGILNQIAKPAAAVVKTAQTPEELCDITPKMSKDQIQAQLKLLYRRYNRSASSLDSKIRKEADDMLTAIVVVREKNFGEI